MFILDSKPLNPRFSNNGNENVEHTSLTLGLMMGHAVFPDINDNEDGWRQKVEDRFANSRFPDDKHACSDITSKCFRQQ
jgi:hypothetical protein